VKVRAIVVAIAAVTATTLSAQQASLRTVMERSAEYVADFEAQLGGIVVEEHYTQEVIPPGPFNTAISMNSGALGRGGVQQAPMVQTSTGRTYRDLRSDLLLVHPINGARWVQFRDVFEMDRTVVHDRNDRLAKLFLKPSADIAQQAERIQNESSRYNIGNLERTVNVPVLPLMFLEATLQPNFEFTRILDASVGDKPAIPKDVPDSEAFEVPAGAVAIEFHETGGGLIRTTAERPLPAHGRFWLDPITGSVFVSELLLDDPLFVYGAIHVAYKLNSDLGFMVPIEMREHYLVRGTGFQINGTATYSRFRRFQVNVDEQLEPTGGK
jgi:hypothetical protein